MKDVEEIIKAFEHFVSQKGEGVILYDGDGSMVRLQDIVDLIHGQKAEIERLTEEIKEKYVSKNLYELAQKVGKTRREELIRRNELICKISKEKAELQKQVKEFEEVFGNADNFARVMSDLRMSNGNCIATSQELLEWVKQKTQQAIKDTEKKILTGILSNCKMAKEKIVNMIVNEHSCYRLGYEKAIEHYTDFILCVAKEKGVEVE